MILGSHIVRLTISFFILWILGIQLSSYTSTLPETQGVFISRHAALITS